MNEFPFCQNVLNPINRKEFHRYGLIILTNHFNEKEKNITYPAFGILGFRYSKVYTKNECVTYCENNGKYPKLAEYIKSNNIEKIKSTYLEPFIKAGHTKILPTSNKIIIKKELTTKYKTFLYNRKKGGISDGKIWAIRYQIASGKPIKMIANDFGLNRKNINDIIKYHLVPVDEVTEEWYTWYYTKCSSEDVKFDKKQKFKRLKKRRANINEIEFILKKSLEDWKPIKIYNVIMQDNPTSMINREWVDNISKGTVRILKDEVSAEKFTYLQNLKQKVMNKKVPI